MSEIDTIRAVWPGEWRDEIYGFALDLLPTRSRSRLLLGIHTVTIQEDGEGDDEAWYVYIHTGSPTSEGRELATGSDLADTVRHARATLRAATETLLEAVTNG